MDISILPAINAGLNGTSFVLLSLGYLFIRQRALTAHTMSMLAACGTSTLFLISYITYHLQHGVTRFQGTGLLRPLYFFILSTHTVLAVTIVPLAITTLVFGLKGKFQKHVAIAHYTLPLWMYVSVTGVVIYFMLYHIGA